MKFMPAEPSIQAIGTVAELWRYPVKSLRGEQLPILAFDRSGVVGDRRFAFQSSGAPIGKPLLTGRERAGMLLYTAEGEGDAITLTTPSGERLSLADPSTLRHLETALGTGYQLSLLPSETPLTDCRPVSLLSQQTVTQLSEEFDEALDPRRFRSNLFLDLRGHSDLTGATGFAEDALVGHRIRIGSTVVLNITERDPRCRIVILDPDTAEPNPALMKLIDRLHSGRVGVYAGVLTPGTIHPGDPVTLL